MTAKDALTQMLESTRGMLNMFLADISDADLLVRSCPGANHIAWQLGHLISSEASFVKELPGADTISLPEGFADAHKKDTASKDTGFFDKATYLAAFKQVRDASVKALKQLRDDFLDKPNPGPMAQLAPTFRRHSSYWLGTTLTIDAPPVSSPWFGGAGWVSRFCFSHFFPCVGVASSPRVRYLPPAPRGPGGRACEGGRVTVTFTVRELAEWVGGELVGDGGLPIADARPLSDAQLGDITFVEDLKHYSAWHASAASAALVPNDAPVNGKPVIRVPDPLAAFATVVQRFHVRGTVTSAVPIDPTARIHPTVFLAPGVTVGPYAVIGEGSRIGLRSTIHAGVVVGRFCTLGEDVILYPHAVLYDDSVLGNRTIVHAQAVIGADGFGYRSTTGRHVKAPQLGCVEVGDDVEIGAGATVDRGTFGPTRIGAGTKIDNLVMIGHNCQIGRHNLLCSQVGIAGSVTTGDFVVMAGQVGVADHLAIGDKVVIGAKAGVHTDIEANNRMLGFPVTTYHEQLRMMAALRKLPAALAQLKRLTDLIDSDESEGKAAA